MSLFVFQHKTNIKNDFSPPESPHTVLQSQREKTNEYKHPILSPLASSTCQKAIAPKNNLNKEKKTKKTKTSNQKILHTVEAGYHLELFSTRN